MKILPDIGLLLLLLLLTGTARSQDNRLNKVPFTVTFSTEGGFYDEPVTVALHSLPGATIRYTLNGNEPLGSDAMTYRKPISIHKNTVIRAIAIRGKERSSHVANSYFIGEPPSNLPTASLIIPPEVLFDPIDGMYRKGPQVIDSLYKKPGANFWSRLEVPAHLQLFEANGRNWYNSRIGFRLFGGLSRLLPQKSFTVVARKQYGEKRITAEIFGKGHSKKYKYLVFRNGGSDFGHSHFRDPLMTCLVNDWDLEKQASQPCRVYLNGDYWGIYNIREKVNRHFIQDHSETDKDSVEILEHNAERNLGSRKHYLAMMRFLESNELSDPPAFDSLQKLMDVENFMRYQIAQIYFDNRDAGGNIKYWRPVQEDGRWRWILYDTDWGFGLHRADAYTSNSLAFHTNPNGPSWPNPPWSTFILRKLLENQSFREDFVNRFCDYLNTSFEEERVQAKIDSFYNLYLPEMPRHLQRWRLRREKWDKQVDILRNFARQRPAFVRAHLKNYFSTGPETTVQLQQNKGGRLILNQNIDIASAEWKGIYFQNTTLRIEARPFYGYRFSHWEGLGYDSRNPLLILYPEKAAYRIRAVYEKYQHPLEGKLIINEISCNNNQTEDWIELYNNSDSVVQLKGWILADRKHAIRLPEYTLNAKDYALLVEDSADFVKVYPNAYGVAANFSFGLDKRREDILLYDPNGAFIDSAGYELAPRDSIFTLSLLLPDLDNSRKGNWEIRNGWGTPNRGNPYFMTSIVQYKQKLWMEIGGLLAVLMLGLLSLYLRTKGVF